MDKKEIQSVWAAYLEVQEAKKKMDAVGKEDGDVDNDGDEDSSDEYLANRRKKVGAAMKKDDVKEGEESPYPSLDKKKREKKGSNLEPANTPSDKLKGESVEEAKKSKKLSAKELDKRIRIKDKKTGKTLKGFEGLSDLKPGESKTFSISLDFDGLDFMEGAEEGEKEECPKCKGKGCDHCDDKGYHMKEYGMVKAGKKMKESALFSEEELAALEERAGTKGPAPAAPEEFMSTNSPNDKKVFADHEAGSDKKLEDYEDTSEKDASKAGRAVKSQSSARRGDNLKVGDNAMPTPTKSKGQ